MGQIQTTRNPHDITCELRRVLPRHSDILSAGPTPRRQSVKQPDSKPQATISRAVGEVRPLLAGRGHAVPDRPGVRLRTLADVVAYAEHEGVVLRLDATETQVNRPAAHRPGRRAFISGKKNLNTIKTTIISDGAGRTLWTGAHRPGRQHDQTAFDTEGIDDLLDHFPHARALVDAGYRGLRKRHRGQIVAPPPSTRSRNTVSVVTADIRDRARQRHSSQRIAVEHAIAAHKQ
ncbi:transposase family protein [Pseudonocardia sp. ICBG1142]|uniref:transposase family protein n=1 Tax=Pseudonocardia sp. ICBG1142 TaxID=2846760 RepID=UPI001CF64F35|nr:transposase family protein [Pseudonocardia sp. ICBG1142]